MGYTYSLVLTSPNVRVIDKLIWPFQSSQDFGVHESDPNWAFDLSSFFAVDSCVSVLSSLCFLCYFVCFCILGGSWSKPVEFGMFLADFQ